MQTHTGISKKRITLDNEVSENIDIIIPSKNLNEIVKLISEDDGNIELHIFTNKVIFKIGTLIVMTRLINGEYPDTKKLFEKLQEKC